MAGYDPKLVEARWQEAWRKARVMETPAGAGADAGASRFYLLEMFPYPSGTLHLGHVRGYTMGDALARFLRARGREVLHPMGWDAFGLPAERTADLHRTWPAKWTYSNIAYMRRQFQRLGWLYDWRRELVTCAPEYYRWSQLFFLQMLERDLVYRARRKVNWCPSCRTALADEQARRPRPGQARACWRCESAVELRELDAWFARTTRYGAELEHGLDALEGWPAPVKARQRAWLARGRDWCISRQRHWGTPIPVVNCTRCGAVPVKAESLPVRLAEDAGDARASCPRCGAEAARETDTLDTYFDSSWYYLRFCTLEAPERAGARPFAAEDARAWLPIGLYIGGSEQATLHLYYFRFFHRALQDLGWLPADVPREPARRLLDPGIVTRGGSRMSKSRGNVVDPDALVEKYGADATRLYVLFAAPPSRNMEWNETQLKASFRLVLRIWRIFEANLSLVRDVRPSAGPQSAPAHAEARQLRAQAHRALERVTQLLERDAAFGRAIATLMTLVRAISKFKAELNDQVSREVLREALEILIKLLGPITPHLAEELWKQLGHDSLLALERWPAFEKAFEEP